jgi:hypothetical protein
MPAPLEATMFAFIPGRPEVGDVSPKVPKHLSVVPWVILGDWRHDIFADVQKDVEAAGPILVRPGGMMVVGGEGHEKKAQRIISPELQELHVKLLFRLATYGVVVSHPEWAGRNYTPHITTEQPILRAATTIDTIHAIDNEQCGDDNRGTKVITQAFRARQL